MSNINLLPWRQARAQRQKKQFGILFGLFLAGTAAIAFAADWLVQQQIGYQQQRNQRLQQEMATLDTQLGEIRLLKERRKELIREFNFEVRHSPMPPDGTLRIP